MGRVFTWEDVVEKRVPNTEHSFNIVGKHVRESIKNFDVITDAGFLGTFIFGKHSIRSDIDCVLVFSEKNQRECISFFQQLNLVANNYHVPLELRAIPQDIASSPYHTMHTSYLNHIRRAMHQGGTIKGNIVEAFKKPEKTIREEAVSYIERKISMLRNNLHKRSVLSCEKYHHLLTKSLEAPLHIARKICEVYGVDFGDDDSRLRVVEEYYAACRELYYLHNNLLNFIYLDNDYTKELYR